VELLRKVGFDDRLIEARPRQMSGGQRQRLCIAKALATEPKVLILDEAVAALDPLIQKQILDLLKEIQQSEGLIYLFITHNLDVARSMADVSIYLNEGKMAEIPESWSV
jgi:peptide/nickel transport system ATP-binding protein